MDKIEFLEKLVSIFREVESGLYNDVEIYNIRMNGLFILQDYGVWYEYYVVSFSIC